VLISKIGKELKQLGSKKTRNVSWVLWSIPIIPTLERLRQEDGRVSGQHGLHSKTLSQNKMMQYKAKQKTNNLILKTRKIAEEIFLKRRDTNC
jgi:hypothetical protein